MKNRSQPIQMPLASEESTRLLLERQAPAAAFMCIAIVLVTAAVIIGVVA